MSESLHSKDIEFDWVDAFSDEPFKGNGCSVVYNAEHWDLEKRLQYVRETSLTECTFVSASQNADYRVQYYLATREIPFAGHPTIATAKSLYDRELISENAHFETGAGIIPVKIEPDGFIAMTQNAPEFGAEFDRQEIAEIYGLDADAIIYPPQWVSTGLPFIVTLLKNQNQLDHAKLNDQKLVEFQKRHKLEGFLEPYLVTLEHEYKDKAFSLARLLLSPPMPSEDPFTGSATGCAAAYLFQLGLCPDTFTHAQGHVLNRLGFAKLTFQGTPNSIGSITVCGKGHILMRGTIKA